MLLCNVMLHKKKAATYFIHKLHTCWHRSWMWSHMTFAEDSTSSWEERRGWTMVASPGEIKQMSLYFFMSCSVWAARLSFPGPGVSFDFECWCLLWCWCCFYHFASLSYSLQSLLIFFGGIYFFKFKVCVWITDVLQSLHCKSHLLFPPDTSSHCHPCLPCLTLSPHSSMTCIHPSPCFPGLSFCTLCLFFPVGSGLMFFPLWFCILSLSLVSRQWFYPMVGDIMLFYHRVEPRTGCWRVSASIRQSIPTSFHKPQNRGVWLWWWSSWCWCWWAINHPNMHLFVCFVDYIPPCVHIPYFYVVLINLTFG